MPVAEAPGRPTPKAGETVRLGADLSDVYVFDEGGEGWRWGRGEARVAGGIVVDGRCASSLLELVRSVRVRDAL